MEAYGGVWDLLHSFLPLVLDQFQVSVSLPPRTGPKYVLNTKLRVSRLQIMFQNFVTPINLELWNYIRHTGISACGNVNTNKSFNVGSHCRWQRDTKVLPFASRRLHNSGHRSADFRRIFGRFHLLPHCATSSPALHRLSGRTWWWHIPSGRSGKLSRYRLFHGNPINAYITAH